ncbi:MAG TPA: hypothetical protein VLA28_07580, partial [Afifellaceae bacterium]|nr:hypothetical protein [Afifellaceae bacterium]
AVEGEETATSSIEGLDAESEIYPIGKPVSAPPSPPVADAEAPPTEPSAPVEVAALPKPPAIAEAEPAAGADTLSPAVAPKPARPATVPQGERFDPADGRDPIAKY